MTASKIGRGRTRTLFYGLLTAGIIAAATGVGWLLRLWGFPETNIVLLYLLSVLLTARLTPGYAYGLASSVAATAAFNYFFTSPLYTLSVSDPSYLITFTFMTATAVFTSALTSKVKQTALEARESAAETAALLELTNRLTDAADMESIAGIAAGTVSRLFGCRAACLCWDENGQPEQSFLQQQGEGKQVRRRVDEPSELCHRFEDLRTAYAAGEEFWDWPVYGGEAILAALRIPKETAAAMDAAQVRLLHAVIESASLAMDRIRSGRERTRSREEAEQERYRSSLLRAISHDLRTPLAGIMGTAEMLADMSPGDDPRRALAEGIRRDSDWLFSLVENILSLTRLQDGRLTIQKETEAAEEVIAGAVSRVTRRWPGHDIAVSVPDEVLLVPMDARLIEQVMINLLDNACKHTAPEDEILVTAAADRENLRAVFTVADRGAGIAAADLPHIFQMFYTSGSRQPDAVRGVGLGLTICEAIVKAHGGTIRAENRTGGSGAVFVFTLPLEETNHAEPK